MKIEKCVGDYFAITAKNDEEITTKDVQNALTKQGIFWIGAITRYAVNKEEIMIHVWTKPKEKSTVSLDFKDCKHPYLMTIIINTLNNWGYDVFVLENCQKKLLFERREIFYQEELSKMMNSQ